ncbi:MAG: NAD-dependent epimerase/dehydratase family protein [Solirubrobacteraceae bacterium]
MRALVTGGAGFIGSNLVDALTERGDDVVVVDDLSTGRSSNLAKALSAGARLHEVDIRDAAAMRAVVADQRTEAIFHLAAQIDVRHSVSDPARDAEVNIHGTINVLEAARQEGVRRVVYSATGGAIYGKADTYPTPEDDPVRPLAPYGQSKYAAEGYCDLYRRLHGISVVTLRYANVYGPRQDPLGEGGVIAIFCGRLTTGESPTVFGDGRQTRDYTYVGDVVGANLLAAESETIGAYNIGTGVETSVLDLIAVMAPMSRNGTFSPEFVPARPGEVQRSVLDASQARAALGWQPMVDLRDGLKRTLQSL